MPKRGAEGERSPLVLLGLDALTQDRQVRALGLGVDGIDHLGQVLGRRVLDQAQVELDDVRVEERHQRKRGRLAAHVVERYAPAEVAHRAGSGE